MSYTKQTIYFNKTKELCDDLNNNTVVKNSDTGLISPRSKTSFDIFPPPAQGGGKKAIVEYDFSSQCCDLNMPMIRIARANETDSGETLFNKLSHTLTYSNQSIKITGQKVENGKLTVHLEFNYNNGTWMDLSFFLMFRFACPERRVYLKSSVYYVSWACLPDYDISFGVGDFDAMRVDYPAGARITNSSIQIKRASMSSFMNLEHNPIKNERRVAYYPLPNLKLGEQIQVRLNYSCGQKMYSKEYVYLHDRPIENVKIRSGESGNYTLSWNRGIDNFNYTVSYRKQQDQLFTEINTISNSAILTGIETGYRYEVSIRKNETGEVYNFSFETPLSCSIPEIESVFYSNDTSSVVGTALLNEVESVYRYRALLYAQCTSPSCITEEQILEGNGQFSLPVDVEGEYFVKIEALRYGNVVCGESELSDAIIVEDACIVDFDYTVQVTQSDIILIFTSMYDYEIELIYKYNGRVEYRNSIRERTHNIGISNLSNGEYIISVKKICQNASTVPIIKTIQIG